MTKFFRIFIIFVIMIGLLLIAPGSSHHFTMIEKNPVKTNNTQVVEDTEWVAPVWKASRSPISCLYFDEQSFKSAVSFATVYKENIESLHGGIVPHHLLASDMIASFWETVSHADYDLVVIIGPDHNRRGASPVTTITSGFTTVFGDVMTDSSVANFLIQENMVVEDRKIMETEHSVSSHIPFIRYYMPDTPVLPLLVYGNYSFSNVKALSEKITEATQGKKVLYVASIDFSHYLSLEEANKMDNITEKALIEFNYKSISEMTNDNLDSRPSALFMLYTMSRLKAKSIEKWAHSNSDYYFMEDTGYTTSYFNLGFSKSEEKPETRDSDIIENQHDKYLHVMAVGDIMLGRGVAKSLMENGLGYLHPFTEVFDFLKGADILFGNLEHPITDRQKSLDKEHKYILKSGSEAIQGIHYAGFNILSLANNHIMDYYAEGLDDTIRILDDNKISYTGAEKDLIDARKPAIIEKKGVKVAFLAYTDFAEIKYQGNPPLCFAADIGKPGVAPLRPEFILEDIQEIREKADILIISLHWGKEDTFQISEQQKELARKLCDTGADIILGHHPHWFQGIEIYNGKPIVYSLGNFIFDQPGQESKESFILDFTYQGAELTGITAIPVQIMNNYRIVPQKGDKAKEMLERQLRLSEELGTSGTILDDMMIMH